MTIQRIPFFAGYRQAFGKSAAPLHLKQSQVDGLEALLTFIENDAAMSDVRHVAYLLATVKHECADRWEPIEEFGRGKGRKYGKPTLIKVNGKNEYRTYYGRGYVQTTWLDNYLRMGEAIGLGRRLAEEPWLALDPAISYKLASVGMHRGLYTAKKLSDYINATRCDYVNARRIINGIDEADAIAGYARKFEAVLRAAIVTGGSAA